MDAMAVLTAALHPNKHLFVGHEDDHDGSLRVYVVARYLNLHTHVDDEQVKASIRAASLDATVIEIPREALCDCPPPTPKEA